MSYKLEFGKAFFLIFWVFAENDKKWYFKVFDIENNCIYRDAIVENLIENFSK